MTQYLPTNFRKKIKQKLDKIELFKKILDSNEIDAVLPKFLSFFEDPTNEDKIFNDGTRDWIVLQSPEKTINAKPKEAESDFSDDNYLWICKFKLGQLNVFGTWDQMKEIGWGNTVLTTGKLNRKFKLIGQQGFHKNLGKLAEAFNLKLEEIAEDDYTTSYSYNLYQIIGHL